MQKTSMEYGKALQRHALELCQKADRSDNPDRAKELRGLAGAIEWLIALALPRFVTLEFDVLYRAALDNPELYNTLSDLYGSDENVEIAARMRGLRDD